MRLHKSEIKPRLCYNQGSQFCIPTHKSHQRWFRVGVDRYYSIPDMVRELMTKASFEVMLRKDEKQEWTPDTYPSKMPTK